MIEELLTWVAEINLLNQQSQVTQSQSNLVIALAYIVTIKRTRAFAAGFFLCLVASSHDFFGLIYDAISYLDGFNHDIYYGLLWWCATMLTWMLCIFPHIIFSRNKRLLFCCGTMLTLYLLMAVDWYANTYNTESFLSKAYPYIVSVIHVAICLSLYNTTKIYNSITNHVYGFMFAFRYFRLVSYFWYTSRYR